MSHVRADFVPPFYMRSAFAQTLLASFRFQPRDGNPMLAASKEVTLQAFEDVRLQGFYSPQAGRSKGLVMLLHGWEGSADSAYILGTGRFLYEHGFSIFRLNFRDHGGTHALNPGIFYAVLLDEVLGAVRQVAQYEGVGPFFLAGFSMGGNFALRIARRVAADPIPNLAHVFSVSPALDPEKSTLAIDRSPFLRPYFRKKWLDSLKKKQALFPQFYDLNEVSSLSTLVAMTDLMIRRHSPYPGASEYFRAYAVLGDALAGLKVPTTILTAQDDPIIPVRDFSELKPAPSVELIVLPHGGHNGFLLDLTGRTWYADRMLEAFSRSAA